MCPFGDFFVHYLSVILMLYLHDNKKRKLHIFKLRHMFIRHSVS